MRIESIWIETLKQKATEILIRKIKPIANDLQEGQFKQYFIWQFEEKKLFLKFNFDSFSKDYNLIWKNDDPTSYTKMIEGGIGRTEYRNYFEDYTADKGKLIFEVQHKLMMTLLFQRLGKCCVEHILMGSRPLSRRRLTGPYKQLVDIFKNLDDDLWKNSRWNSKESDLLVLHQNEKVIDLLFFLSRIDEVMNSEKLDEVVRFIIEVNLRVREMICNSPELNMKNLLMQKKYHSYSAISQLFRRVLLVYSKLFEMIGKPEWVC